MCDEVAVMYKGELVEYGNVKEVFTNPKHEYTKGLMACRPDIYKKTYRLPVIADFISKNSDTLQLREISRKEEKAKMTDICSGTKLLEVQQVNLKYPVRTGLFSKTKSWVTAIENLSFDLYKGESLGLVGESGSGKTSLGKVILRVQEADSGKIFYKNKDITKLEGSELRKLRKEIQVVFQDPYGSLNPSLTINSALTEPILVHKLASGKKEAMEKVAFLLESVGIDPALGTRFPHEFSGGQRQRICIARALTVEPEFIVCDEAVSALDVSVQAQVLNLLADLQEKFNLSYLFITHDLSVVRFLCSRVMVMKSGKLEETLPAYDLLEQAKENYTKELIASIPGRFS
jgi:peptide/nickel transport system ATP-binding protein